MCLTKLLIEIFCIKIQNENQSQVKKCVPKLELVYTDLQTHTPPSYITDLFSLVFIVYQQWSTPIRLQDSDSSTCHIMCDVPRTIIFCSEHTKCFPHKAYKFFFKPTVTIPVASIMADTYNRALHVHSSLYVYTLTLLFELLFSFHFHDISSAALTHYNYKQRRGNMPLGTFPLLCL